MRSFRENVKPKPCPIDQIEVEATAEQGENKFSREDEVLQRNEIWNNGSNKRPRELEI